MADKPYRFLFRMPQQLRERLVASAEEHGRSLNSELLHRLERSLEVDARIPLMARIAGAARSLAARASLSRPVPRIGAALAVGATVLVAAVGVSTMRGQAPTQSDGLGLNGSVVQVPFPMVKPSAPVRVPAEPRRHRGLILAAPAGAGRSWPNLNR